MNAHKANGMFYCVICEFHVAYMDVGKGREQGAEALPTWT